MAGEKCWLEKSAVAKPPRYCHQLPWPCQQHLPVQHLLQLLVPWCHHSSSQTPHPPDAQVEEPLEGPVCSITPGDAFCPQPSFPSHSLSDGHLQQVPLSIPSNKTTRASPGFQLCADPAKQGGGEAASGAVPACPLVSLRRGSSPASGRDKRGLAGTPGGCQPHCVPEAGTGDPGGAGGPSGGCSTLGAAGARSCLGGTRWGAGETLGVHTAELHSMDGTPEEPRLLLFCCNKGK